MTDIDLTSVPPYPVYRLELDAHGAVNVDGVFNTTRAVVPSMVARRRGCVVNIASWLGRRGMANYGVYAATKFAVVGFTQTLAAEHRLLEAQWQRLRAALALLAGGDATALAPALVQDFNALYAGHIAREEAELLPMAERLLDDATLDRVGLAMRRRRGVADPA